MYGGGPNRILPADTNVTSVVIMCDPAEYEPVMSEWQDTGEVSAATRKRLAVKAFRHVSEYDALIADFLWSAESKDITDDFFPEAIDLNLKKVQVLRYGENPHQEGALYSDKLPVACTTLEGSLN